MTRVAIALSAVALAGCGSLLSFDIDSSGSSTIPAGPNTGLLSGLPGFSGFGNMSFSQNSAFQNNNTNKDHVTEARLTKLALTVVSPTGKDLSFLSSLEFFIEAPNLPKVRIASGTSFPVGVGTVNLTLDDRDIAAYAKSDSFSITTNGSGHSPSQDTTVRADLTLNVHASIL